MTSVPKPNSEKLLGAGSFREFLREALAEHYAPRRPNLADFSRRAGFASRSYLPELLAGKKGLSRDGFSKLQRGLRLPRPYLRYLECLAWEEFPELRPAGLAAEQIAQRKRLARGRARELSAPQPNASGRTFSRPVLLRVYAALGTLESGASLAEITARTKLSAPAATAALAELQRAGAARRAGDRYLPEATALDFLGLKETDGLAHLARDVGQGIAREAGQILAREENLFFYSALSVRRSQLVAFKAKVREALLETLDQHQHDEGETVVQVFLGAWH